MSEKPIRVLCVDDNDFVAEAIRRKLLLESGFEWLGWLEDASGLLESARGMKPDVILLDIDMPGEDSFEALESLAANCPAIRVIMLSGHVRRELIDRAVEAGAWGYISKNDETDHIVAAIRRVAAGEFTLGPDAETEYRRR